jgi:hypothetical protein
MLLLNNMSCHGMQLDEVRHRLSETASQIKEKARGYGSEAKGFVQSKTDTGLAA